MTDQVPKIRVFHDDIRMDYSNSHYLRGYPEDTQENADIVPLPYCKSCGTVLDFEDAACNCDIF